MGGRRHWGALALLRVSRRQRRSWPVQERFRGRQLVRGAFEELGGYTTDRHVGYEDWEFYSKAAFRGFSVETVPFSLYHYRFTAGSMQKSTSYSKSRRRALRQYLGQSREFRRAAQEAEAQEAAAAPRETPQTP